MISPYEIVALLIVVPIVGVGVWISNRFDTDGASVPEFEVWCKTARPMLFAIRCAPAEGRELVRALLARVGPLRRVEHHRGRFPWTRYVLTIAISMDEDGVVRGHVERAAIRRIQQRHPDLCKALEECLTAAGVSAAAWVHTEMHPGDETRGEARRGRGWVATVDRGVIKEFVQASTAPEWALGVSV